MLTCFRDVSFLHKANCSEVLNIETTSFCLSFPTTLQNEILWDVEVCYLRCYRSSVSPKTWLPKFGISYHIWERKPLSSRLARNSFHKARKHFTTPFRSCFHRDFKPLSFIRNNSFSPSNMEKTPSSIEIYKQPRIYSEERPRTSKESREIYKSGGHSWRRTQRRAENRIPRYESAIYSAVLYF